MAIKARDQVKWVINSATLELEADTGEAFIVKDILVTSISGGYLTVSIDKTTVGYFRVNSAKLGNHLRFSTSDIVKYSILRYLWDRKLFSGYPVAEGQKIVLNTTGNTYMVLIYDIYEPGDVSPDMENGSEAKEYLLLNYGRYSGGSTLADGDNLYDKSILPSEFPDFPFGRSVPAKTTINILGILASDVGNTSGSGANKQRTQYLKLIKEREVLFNEDKEGLLMYGSVPAADSLRVGLGSSVVGNYTEVDEKLPLLFTEPLSFASGEELTVIVNTDVLAGSPNIDVELGEIAFIEKVIRTG